MIVKMVEIKIVFLQFQSQGKGHQRKEADLNLSLLDDEKFNINL